MDCNKEIATSGYDYYKDEEGIRKVKSLREETACPWIECRLALVEAKGNYRVALRKLREKFSTKRIF